MLNSEKNNTCCKDGGVCAPDCNTEAYENVVLSVGDTLPEGIALEAYQEDEIKKISFSDYRGRWLVLFFYPADFTFVCPTELEEMAEHYKEFKELGAEVLSVSTDTAFAHKAWHDTSPSIKKITFPMVADPTAMLSELLGTYIYEAGESLRGSFIVDPEGVIKLVEINDNDIGRSAQELLRKLAAAKYVYEHKGEGLVCPASWKPGDEGMSKSTDQVGKI